MPKITPHPFVAWRNGRPRFAPGPEMRAAGYKGQDLKHPDGSWFSFGEAVDWSREFCSKQSRSSGAPRATGIPREQNVALPQKRNSGHFPPGRPAGNQQGYIYFLWVNDRVKIGFTTNPGQRLLSLKTGMGHPAKLIAVVQGTRDDEKALHDVLRGKQAQGEWFKPTLKVVRVLQQRIQDSLGPLARPFDAMRDV